MKIFAVTGNCPTDEGTPNPFGAGEATWYEIPDSAISHSGNPFFVPDFDNRFAAFPSVAYRIGKLGKTISRRFAGRYVDGATIGFSVVALDTLKRLRESGQPWTQAVAFDRSCLLGNFQPIDTFINNGPYTIEAGSERRTFDPMLLVHPIEEVIEWISAQNTLKTGDVILAGLNPAGFPLEIGMRLRAAAANNNTNALDINIR